ncbi:MAG TPA: MFS transporter [Bacillota bacterium]|nr:MFS transporter [Bacillota bacterium]
MNGTVQPKFHGREDRHRWLILANVSLGTFMATLDGSIANVALPTIASEVNQPLHIVQWVLTAYLLTICATLPIIGKLSDLVGRTKVYNYGFLIFTIGSAGCGLSHSLGFLIAARVLQAIGASCLMSNSQAIIAETFREGRGKAMGITGTVVSVGSLTGPGIGGLLVGSLGWPSIFWINIPIGILAFAAGWFILPKQQSHLGAKQPFDYWGSVLFVLGMLTFLYTISNAEEWGWVSGQTLGLGIFSILSLTSFYILERKISYPMLDFSLYSIRAFAIGNIAALLSFVSLFCTNVMMPFYMQNVLHYTPATTGYAMMAYPLTMAIVAPFSGWLSDKIGPSILTTGGLVINALGFALLNTLSGQVSPWIIGLHLSLFGLGGGMFQSPNNASVMGSVPKAKLGTAGGLNALIRNMGMVLGIALSVSLYSYQIHELTGQIGNVTDEASMLSALHLVFWTAMGVCLIGALISSMRLKQTLQ